jgi:DNA-binding phage protein
MALTRDFRETIRDRAQREPSFRHALLREALQLINSGDFSTGRSILRNYINATIGFPKLARATKISSPSLQRMFGPSGNPSAQNLFGVIAALQKAEGITFELQIGHDAPVHRANPDSVWETKWHLTSAGKPKAPVYLTFFCEPESSCLEQAQSAVAAVRLSNAPDPEFIPECEELCEMAY